MNNTFEESAAEGVATGGVSVNDYANEKCFEIIQKVVEDCMSSADRIRKLERSNLYMESSYIMQMVPNIKKDDFKDGKFEYYLTLIWAYRHFAIRDKIALNAIEDVLNDYNPDTPIEETFNKIVKIAKSFSGRKPNKLRQEARDFALKQKQELLQKGKSNTEANTIVIYQLERHPIYGNYVKDLGKEALRKLLQTPKTPKEKNGK